MEKDISRTHRSSNIELFRILVMFLIVSHHYVVNSGLAVSNGPVYAAPLSANSLFLEIMGAWGKTGINCFILITGYYMCKSHITLRKFLKLFLEVMFYRIIIRIVFWITGYDSFSVQAFLLMLIPIKSISNGFTPAFLVFYLCIPFLNILVHNMDETKHRQLLLLSGFLYILLGSVPKLFSVRMNYVSWFCVVYFISSYIRLYPKAYYEKLNIWVWLTVLSASLATLSVLACAWYSAKAGKQVLYPFVVDSNAILPVIVSVCSFMLFKNLNIGYSKVINTIASSTFGVLLIHAHSDTMKTWLWKDVVDCVGHYSSALYAIGSVILIFCVCILIDQLRIHFIEIPFFRLLDQHVFRHQAT